VRKSRTLGSVRAKAEWLRYWTIARGWGDSGFFPGKPLDHRGFCVQPEHRDHHQRDNRTPQEHFFTGRWGERAGS
jgi:hypothetical protein